MVRPVIHEMLDEIYIAGLTPLIPPLYFLESVRIGRDKVDHLFRDAPAEHLRQNRIFKKSR